ncbi:hypothetical protein [Paenibacillus sp. PL91]|nr:hypothetical protein [Paenibacillus sp. PL91]
MDQFKFNHTGERLIFPKGEKITNTYFTGTAWLEMLISNDDTFNYIS